MEAQADRVRQREAGIRSRVDIPTLDKDVNACQGRLRRDHQGECCAGRSTHQNLSEWEQVVEIVINPWSLLIREHDPGLPSGRGCDSNTPSPTVVVGPVAL